MGIFGARKFGAPMSDISTDALEFDDNDETRPLKASVREIFDYVIARWVSQSHYLAAFIALYLIAVSCDLALPVVSGEMVEALTAGPGAAHAAVWSSYYAFAAVAFGFYFFRNTSVRFWIPLAARNMRDIVDDGFKDVQRFSSDWHADNFAGASEWAAGRDYGDVRIRKDVLTGAKLETRQPQLVRFE